MTKPIRGAPEDPFRTRVPGTKTPTATPRQIRAVEANRAAKKARGHAKLGMSSTMTGRFSMMECILMEAFGSKASRVPKPRMQRMYSYYTRQVDNPHVYVFESITEFNAVQHNTQLLLHQTFTDSETLPESISNESTNKTGQNTMAARNGDHSFNPGDVLDEWARPSDLGLQMVDFISADALGLKIRVRVVAFSKDMETQYTRHAGKMFIGMAEFQAPHKMIASFVLDTGNMLAAIAMVRSANLSPGRHFLPTQHAQEDTESGATTPLALYNL